MVEWANLLPQKVWDVADPLTIHLEALPPPTENLKISKGGEGEKKTRQEKGERSDRESDDEDDEEEEEGRVVKVSGSERWGEILKALHQRMSPL